MRTSSHLLIGLMSIVFVCGLVGLVLPPPSQADVQFGGIKKLLKKNFPPCGPGTRDQRFVVKGEKVCDNKTGLWWQQNPSTSFEDWQGAVAHCADLTLSGKTWRLPTLQEIQWDSLIDYSVPNKAAALNNGPFTEVQLNGYWLATEVAGGSMFAWVVTFGAGEVAFTSKGNPFHAWCVSGGQDEH